MSEVVCPDVGIEPTLQPVTEEQFQLRTTNREDGARLDFVAQSFWSNNRQSAFFNVRVFNPYAPIPIAAPPWPRATEETRWR